MEKKTETTIVFGGYIGIMENGNLLFGFRSTSPLFLVNAPNNIRFCLELPKPEGELDSALRYPHFNVLYQGRKSA